MSGQDVSGDAGAADESRMRWSGFWGRCLIAVVIASAFMGSAVALVDRTITDKVTKIPRVAGLKLAPAPPGGANYLVIGSDTRAVVDPSDTAGLGDTSTVEGQRSDTLMVAHVEPSAQRTFVVSFPRDLVVDVPTVGRTRINEAYSQGGPQLVINTLKANFDIDISHYLEVDFKSFQEIVNEIGNIGVYLPGKIRDPETGLYTPYGGGCYALDGASALAYVRSRTLQVADPNGPIVDEETGEHWRLLDQRADLDRIQRQQTFIRKLASVAISKALSDPFLALSLTNNIIGYLKADESLSRDDVNALVRAFKTVDVNDPNSVDFETLPVDPDPENPTVTLVPGDDDAVIQRLRTFGDDTPKPATVQPSSVTVRVTDSTGTNVGASVVSQLSAQGFHASQGKTAAATIPITEVRYGYGQAEEAKALLAYFPDAKFVPDVNAKDAVQLVLGTSFAGDITVPSTTTTVPATTVPGAPVTTAPTTTLPPTTTTTDPTAACP